MTILTALALLANGLAVGLIHPLIPHVRTQAGQPAPLQHVERLLVKDLQHAGRDHFALLRWRIQIPAEPLVMVQSHLKRECAPVAAIFSTLHDQGTQHNTSSAKEGSNKSAEQRGVSPIHAFWIPFLVGFVTTAAPGLLFLVACILLDRWGHLI